MRKILAIAFLLLPLSVMAPRTMVAQPRTDYDDVALIVNDRSAQSVEIGNYFASRRGITNVLHIAIDTAETIDSISFRRLLWTVKAYLQSRPQISTLVTTKGVPLTVALASPEYVRSGDGWLYGDDLSIEACLALVHSPDSVWIMTPRAWPGPGWDAPYYRSTARYTRSANRNHYLVSRLDGYTVESVKRMIRTAEVTSATGQWVLDPAMSGTHATDTRTHAEAAAAALRAMGLTSITLDLSPSYLRYAQNVLGYYSAGSNDPAAGSQQASRPLNTWRPGGIGFTFVSTSGRTYYPQAGGQSLTADLIEEGAAASWGCVIEPSGGGVPDPEITLVRYAQGWTVAEAFHAGARWQGWKGHLIGDPKMTINRLWQIPTNPTPPTIPTRDTIYVRDTIRTTVVVRDTVYVTNILSITGRDSTRIRLELTLPRR